MDLSKLSVLVPGLFGVAIAMSSGCSAAKNAAEGCDATADGKLLVQANATLEAASNRLLFEVGSACWTIANASGTAPTSWDGKTGQDGSAASETNPPTTDQVNGVCNEAVTVLGNIQAMGSWSISVTGGQCQASIQAQADCTASCSGDASCSGGMAMVQCMGGDLEVSCNGMCSAGASCDWNGKDPISCSGMCSGTCNVQVTGGTCSGTCNGMCQGTCMGQAGSGGSNGMCNGQCMGMCTGTCSEPMAMGTCMGTCSGKCTLQNPAMCDASAKCTGTCMGTASAPSCTGVVQPPMCNASASCKSNCQAQAQASATCTPPTVVIHSSASSNVDFDALSKGLGQIFLVAKTEGPNLYNLAVQVATSFKGALSSNAACLAQVQGLFQVAANINVSAMASASCSAKAGG